MTFKHVVYGLLLWLLWAVELKSQTPAITEWDIASERCFGFTEPQIDSALGLNETDRILKESEEHKKAACAAAEAIIRRRQKVTDEFLSIVNLINDKSVFYERNLLYESVKTAGVDVLATASEVSRITPRLSVDNSKRLSDASTALTIARERLANWARNWDTLHRASEENPSVKLKALLQNADLSENMRYQAQSFLNTLPAYLFGNAAAPRGLLEAYRKSVQALAGVTAEGREYYVSELKRQALEELLPIVTPELLRLKAEQFYSTVKSKFPDLSGLAVVAYSQGACLLAQSILRDRLELLSVATAQSPQKFKPFILEDVGPERSRIEGRLRTFSGCNVNSANVTLTHAVTTRLKELGPLCAEKSTQLVGAWAALVQDAVITNVMDISSKSSSSYETNRQEHLGAIWLMIRKLNLACAESEERQ
jgi:hypothetical protein